MDERSMRDDGASVNEKRQAISIRSAAMDMAIRSSVGMSYDNEGRSINNADKIVEAAKKFEAFIKG